MHDVPLDALKSRGAIFAQGLGVVANAPLLTPVGRGLKWGGFGATLGSAVLIALALVLPWHTIGVSLFGTSADLLDTYPWGGHYDEPGGGCEDWGMWHFSEDECGDDTSDDSSESAKQESSQTLMLVSAGILGLGFLLALFGAIGMGREKRAVRSHAILGLVGGVLILAGVILYMVGEARYVDAVEDQAGFSFENGAQAGLILGWIAVALGLAGPVLDLVGRSHRGSPTGAPYPPTAPLSALPRPGASGAAPAAVRRLVCPKCKSTVEVQAGHKPVCWTCGFGG